MGANRKSSVSAVNSLAQLELGLLFLVTETWEQYRQAHINFNWNYVCGADFFFSQ
jgi:hypothetical protein